MPLSMRGPWPALRAETVNMQSEIARQHLIDPELCIRCNTCEETCPVEAITHDHRNYVVDAERCNACMACIKPCPTGAIDNWRLVARDDLYGVDQQMSWDALPAPGSILEGHAASTTLPSGENELNLALHEKVGHPDGIYSRSHPAVGKVADSVRLTSDDAPSEIRQLTIDLSQQDFPFLEGQTVGIVPPGLDLDGKPHQMRLYSVACPRSGEAGLPGHLSLVVKRVLEQAPGGVVHGICSNYLCDLQLGEQLHVLGPFGNHYLMPADDRAPLLMICTGTGIAPMRAMIDRRRQIGLTHSGKLTLFYGSRTPSETAYSIELAKLSHEAPDCFDLKIAYSRTPVLPKQYVQDLIASHHERVADLLAMPGLGIYVCGLKGMESGVLSALRSVCEQHELNWDDLKAVLMQESRLHIETY